MIHAQQADRHGNVHALGARGRPEGGRARRARTAIATVEEIVDELEPRPHSVVLPAWTIAAVCHVPGGAHPSYAAGYSTRDNDFYSAWDEIARDRDRFTDWMREHVLERCWRESRPTVTPEELMTINAARELRDGQVCLVGVGPPNAAANLARRLQAPGCVLVYESGAIGAQPVRLPLSIGDDDLAETALELVSVPEMFNSGSAAGASTSASSARPRSTATPTSTRPRSAPTTQPKVRLPGRRRRARDRGLREVGDRDRPPLAARLRRAARLRHLARAPRAATPS